jgi:hypothetical protein
MLSEPAFCMDLPSVARMVYDIVAHPRDVASAYGFNAQTVHDATYRSKLPAVKYQNRVVVLWSDVESIWGVRPDRFSIFISPSGVSLYEVHPVKRTVVRFMGDFDSLSQARAEAILRGVRRRFVERIAVERE